MHGTCLVAIGWSAAADGTFASPQSAWEDYTGQPWCSQRGLGWLDAIAPEDREDVRSRWAAARAHREQFCASGRLWHARSAAYRHVMLEGVPIAFRDGEFSGLVGWIGTCFEVAEADWSPMGLSRER